MTDEQVQNAKPLTPGLESLLRSVDLNESVIMAFRVQEVLDKELFVALDTTEEAHRKTCEEAFGINPSKSFLHKKRTGQSRQSLEGCQSPCRRHRGQVRRGRKGSRRTGLHVGPRLDFVVEFGEHLHDTVLPAQSYFESFEEKLSDGRLNAETLAQIVSVAEQDEQESKKAEPQRHMSLHLDGQLTIQTKRRFTSSMRANPEDLRLKKKVKNCWLRASCRRRTSCSSRTSARFGSSAQTGHCAWATNSSSERKLCDSFGKRVSRSSEHSGEQLQPEARKEGGGAGTVTKRKENRRGQLALPAPPTPEGGKGKGKKGKGRGKTPLARGQQIPSFKALMNIKLADRPQLCAEAQNTPGVCFRFQEKRCVDAACSRAHVCVGCGNAM